MGKADKIEQAKAAINDIVNNGNNQFNNKREEILITAVVSKQLFTRINEIQ